MKKPLILSAIFIIIVITCIKPSYKEEVHFTSYYPNDGMGSTTCTATNHCTSEFEINEEGFYTYKDKVVLATCITSCTNSDTGICASFTLPEGYKQYDFNDILTIEINNKQYEAIVLDICGACYWDEAIQRYDIYVNGKESAIDTHGNLIYGISLRGKVIMIYAIILTLAGLFYGFRRLNDHHIQRKHR